MTQDDHLADAIISDLEADLDETALRVKRLETRLAQSSAELIEAARRYDDAVQPLQRRCLELVQRIEAFIDAFETADVWFDGSSEGQDRVGPAYEALRNVVKPRS